MFFKKRGIIILKHFESKIQNKHLLVNNGS